MSTLFNPRSPFAFLLAFIYAIIATIGLVDPYKDFPQPDYPEGSINHHYSQRINGYENWYGYSTIQGILNMINAKDKEGIMSKFSEETKDNNDDISRQIDIMFDYFDGEILDFENERVGYSGYNQEYGHYHNYEISTSADAKTEKYTYHIVISVVLINDDENKVGIESLTVVRTDVQQYFLGIARISGDDYDVPWHQPGRAIKCVDYNGLIR